MENQIKQFSIKGMHPGTARSDVHRLGYGASCA